MSDSRPRGILSPADRAYLAGEADLKSDQSEYDARYRIQERVRHALLDFELLFEHLAEQDRNQVFAPDADEQAAVTEGIVSAIAFLYFGIAEYDPPRKNLFAEGIRWAAEREHDEDSGFCSVRINVDRPTQSQLNHILNCVESGMYHELGENELRALACLIHKEEVNSKLVGRLRTALFEPTEVECSLKRQ